VLDYFELFSVLFGKILVTALIMLKSRSSLRGSSSVSLEDIAGFLRDFCVAVFVAFVVFVGIFSPVNAQQEKPQVDTSQENEPSADQLSNLQGMSKDEVLARGNELNRIYSEVNSNKLKQTPSKDIVLHFKGKSSFRFGRIEVDQKAWEEVKKAVTEVSKENYQAMLSAFDKELHETATIPLCEQNKVRIIDPQVRKSTGPQKKSLNPVLMIQRDLTPQDEKIAYGITTKIMSFDVDTLAGVPDFLKMTGFSCLPARMHVTKKGLVLIEGEDALKNYDQDEKGRLDRGVERLWQALKIRYRSNKKDDWLGQLTKGEAK